VDAGGAGVRAGRQPEGGDLMALDMKYNAKGSIVDGSLAKAMPEAAERIEQEIGDMAVLSIRQRFDRVLRNPTGRLRSQVRVDRVGDDLRVVDGDLPYGAWIEGTSSRNRSTRFKGYATFRTVAREIRTEAVTIAEMVIDETVRRAR
jgi:hypothetical protein